MRVGCASVNFEVEPTAPPAKWDAGDSPTGRADWVPLTAHGTDSTGKSIEVTLHVTGGYIGELEIWTGGYGDFALPRPETLHLEERLPAKTQYAVASALVERLRPHVPAEVELTPTWLGSIEIRAGPSAPDRRRTRQARERLETARRARVPVLSHTVAQS